MNKSHDPPSEAERLQRRAEKRLQEQLTQPGQSPPTATEMLRLVHELQIRQTELELQNHALLEMRTELEQRAEKYADLYDFAPLGYFTLDAEGTIEEINLAGATLLGQERVRLIGQQFSLFVAIATQSVFNAFLAETLVGTCRKTCEVVLAPNGLPPRFMRLEGLGAVSGEQQQCRIVAIDITERKHAEIALQESQVFIKDVLDSLNAHIAVLDHQGFITLVNSAWRRFSEQNGGNIHCMVGANYFQVCRNALNSYEDADAQAALRGIRTVISGTRPCFNLEYPCNAPDQPRWFVMHVLPLSGPHQGVVVTHEDITERKQAEDQLRQYQYMISAMPDAVSLVDKNYIYQIVNEEFLRQTGKSRAEVMGHLVAEVNGEEKFNKVIKENLDRGFAGEVTHCQKSFYFTRKGCLFLDVTYAPYHDDQNTITGVVFSARDITKIKAIEDALSRNEAILNEAQDIAKIGSFVWDLRSDSLEWSKSMLNIARMDPGSCYENLNETIFQRLHPDDRVSVQQQVATMIEQKRTWPMEFRFIRPDGEIIWLRSGYRFEFDPQDRLIRCIGVYHEITERKQMDDALRESEVRFRLLLEQTPSIAAQGYSPDGTVHYWNAAAEVLYGYTAQEAIGQNILDLIIPPEMRSEAEAAIAQMALTGQALPTAELSLMRKDRSRVAVLSSHAVVQIPNKGIELFCLDMDISERKKAEEKLKLSEANLTTLIESTDDIIVSRDIEGKTIVFNNSFARIVKKLFGIEATSGIRTIDYLPPAQRAYWTKTIDKVLGGEKYLVEFSWDFGAETRYYELAFSPIKIDQQIVGFTEFTRDITIRKKVEQAVKDREARLQSIFRVAPVGIGVVIDRVIQEVNELFCQIIGYSRDEVIGKNTRFLYPTDQDYDYVGQEKYRQIAKSGTGTVETLWRRKDGAIINILLSSTPLDTRDLAKGVTFTALDITQRKKTEEKLSASYEYIRAVLDSINDAVFVDDATTGRIIDVNQRMCEMYGYSREDALQADVSQLSLGEEPYSQSDALEWLRKARAEGPQTFEWIAKTRAGDLFWVEVNTRFVRIANEDRFIVTVRDISNRKQAEKTLRQYEYMVSAMSDAVSLVDQNYIYRVVNKEYLRRTGKTYNAIVGHSVADLIGEPIFQHLLKEKLDRCLNGEIIHFQEWFDIENDHRFLDVIYSPYYDNNNVCSGIMVSSRDITEVKRIEQALQESDERYRQLFNSMINGFALHEMIYDEQGQPFDYRFLEINPAFEQFTGMYAIDLIGRTVRQAIPNIENHWIETYGRVTLTGEPVHFESHNRVLNKYFEITAYRPKIGQFACLFSDITERKQVEEALNVALTKYTTLFDLFPLGVTVSDAEGRILESNQMAERLLGISRVVHNRRTIDGPEWQILRSDGSLMPSAEYAAVRALAEHRFVENAEMGIVTAQGKTVWLSVTAAPLPLDGYGVVIAYNDITERKKAEEELQHSLKEKETLLREVHHRVKNNLAAIISLLDLRCNLLTDASIISIFAEISSRIKAMALVHEMLYQSDNLSQIDFQDYLESLVRHLRGSFDPHGAIRFNLAATGIWMNIDTAIPCGLIINELVINALKYAFPPDRLHLPASGDIAITVVRDDNGYTLTVADNGMGLPADLDWRTTRTLGLRLVRMLGQHQLQGTLTLDHTAGTRFTLVFNSHSP